MFERLSKVSAKHREILKETLEEFARVKNFTRIFPVTGSNYYDKFFDVQRPSNKLLYKLLYSRSELSHIFGIDH